MVLAPHDYDRHKSVAKPQRDHASLDVVLLNVAHAVPPGVRRKRPFIGALRKKTVDRIGSANGVCSTLNIEQQLGYRRFCEFAAFESESGLFIAASSWESSSVISSCTR